CRFAFRWSGHRAGECSQKGVRRVGRRLMPRDKRLLARLFGCERDKGFKGGPLTAEQALRLARLQVETVEKRSISIGGRPLTGQVHRIAVLPHDPRSVGKLSLNELAGVLVTLVH